ncbi:MAG: hypothetical protein AMXMBFR33_31410 [Candidatus Xenobia bacterium]
MTRTRLSFGNRATLTALICFQVGAGCLLFSLAHRWGWDAFVTIAIFLGLGLLQLFLGGYLVLSGPNPARLASLLGLTWLFSLLLTALAAWWAIEHASGC